MSDNTCIEWCDATWNVVTGCTPISEGCVNCYARRMANRLRGRFGYPHDDPFRPTFHPDRLDEPKKWRKPQRVFVCSMSDLFHPDVSFADIASIWSEMVRPGTKHTYLVLTKRSNRMTAFIQWNNHESALWEKWNKQGRRRTPPERCVFQHLLLSPNIWLGVTTENQKRYDERWSTLAKIPAAVRWVSMEPLLGPIKMDPLDMPDWIVVGGETGPGARPMDPDWARDIRDQCKEAGVPFFFKQMSRKQPIPSDLMVREFPNAKTKEEKL